MEPGMEPKLWQVQEEHGISKYIPVKVEPEEDKVGSVIMPCMLIKVEPEEGSSISVKEEVLRCIICNESFRSDEDLGVHYNSQHEPEMELVNTYEATGAATSTVQSGNPDTDSGWGDDSDDIAALSNTKAKKRTTNHKRKTQSQGYRCEVCGYTCRSNKNLIKHSAVHSDQKPFQCTHCNSFFKTEQSMKFHQKTKHTEKVMFTCKECGSSFTDHNEFRRHRVHEHVKERLKCPECGLGCATGSDLRKHLGTHSNAKPYECNICKKSFKAKQSLSFHCKTQHKEDVTYQCKECCMTFNSFNEMRRHRSNLHNKERYVCSICGQGCANNAHLSKHYSVHTDAKPFPCQYCDKSFKTKGTLHFHCKTTHSQNSTFKCPECGALFTNHNEFRRHRSNAHLKQRFVCEICGQGCGNNYELAKHLAIHSDARPFTCQHCQKSFKTKRCLGFHIKSQHTQNAVFRCRQCGETFNAHKDVRKHRDTVHARDRYSCMICSKAFIHKQNLVSHIASHSDARPFHCSKCDRAYKTEKSLRRHLKECHTPSSYYPQLRLQNLTNATRHDRVEHQVNTDQRQKQYAMSVCTFCGKMFGSRAILLLHLAKHIVKQYKCYICTKEFRYPASLRIHVNNHLSKARSKMPSLQII